MAKKFDACKAEFAKLEKTMKDAFAINAIWHSYWDKASQLATEAAKEVGRAVQKAKDDGAQGTTLEDFLKVTKVKERVDSFNAIVKEGEKMAAEYQTNRTAYITAYKAMGQLQSDLIAEIAARDQKKVAGLKIESSSVPDMKKLLTALADCPIYLERWQDSPQPKVEILNQRFNREVTAELAKTKDAKIADDATEADKQKLNVALLKNRLNQAMILYKEVHAVCEEVARATITKDGAMAMQKAAAPFKKLEGILDENDRIMADNKKTIENSADGMEIMKFGSNIRTFATKAKAELLAARDALNKLPKA